MEGKRFVNPNDVDTQVFDWGTLKWLSEPAVTAAERFSMGVVILEPGKGHARHNHPGTEEILYFVSGTGEQLVEDERRPVGRIRVQAERALQGDDLGRRIDTPLPIRAGAFRRPSAS